MNKSARDAAVPQLPAAPLDADQAARQWPRSADAHYNRGNALLREERHALALESYDAALHLAPRDEQAWNNRGVALRGLERPEQALESFDRALAIRPEYAAALNNRGLALQALGRPDDALASFNQAVALQSDYAEALCNRAVLLVDLEQPVEALADFDRVLVLRPNDTVALVNRGNALQSLNRHAESLADYERALALEPDDAQVHWNEALARLALGDYRRGWEKYEWRWRNPVLGMPERLSERQQWTGASSPSGQTLLVHAEQGFGDALQFIRYVPEVAARGARVIVACSEHLRELFTSVAGVSGVFVPESGALPDFDLHIPLMSLPLALGTTLESLPARVPYLHADAERAQSWRRRLAAHPGLKVGLVWSGNPSFERALTKACPVAAMAGLVAAARGCVFVSLQKGRAAAEVSQLAAPGTRVLDWTPELGNFAQTAALASALDLVISIDTAVAHLAGGLGLPVWVLLPFSADWRWLIGREDSPWYPTARLYRQPRRGDWDAVIARVAADLVQRAGDAGGGRP